MKLSVVVIAVAFVAAAQGVRYSFEKCILVDVDGSLDITAKDENGTVVKSISPQLTEVSPSAINGTCGGSSDNSASMTVNFGSLEWRLVFTVGTDNLVSLDQVVVFNPTELFNDTSLPAEQVSMSDTGKTTLSPRNESYMCNAEQTLPFDAFSSGNFTFTVSQTIRNLKVQAFDLDNGDYSGSVVDCNADENSTTTVAPSNTTTAEPTNSTTAEPTNSTTVEPTNSTTVEPTTEVPSTTVAPNKGAYAVKGNGVTCIVVKGDIIISNITYTKTDNSTATADDITVPAYNGTNVNVTGSCGSNDTNTQNITITFYGNWALTMNFVKGGAAAQAMLGAEQNEYYVNDIALTYYLTLDFFPNASDAGKPVTVEHKNISGELWKGQVGGGSYKCDADITEPLDEGVQLKTTNLQLKAFNQDNNENFDDDNVSECPADDESNSIVPIAVGAALAGLVVIVLIAYLIGRRRSRRQGYESV